MSIFGPLMGIATLIIIGFGFIWVIRGECCLGLLWWPYFMGLGILMVAGSLFMPSIWGSALMAIFGASLIWGSTELKEQAIRAELGWSPFNENKLKPPFASTIKKWRAPHL